MELLYHYLWKYRLCGDSIKLCDGSEAFVVSPGVHNDTSGPDFYACRIRFHDSDWVGNAEVHVKASDWFRHGHQSDPAYDNVIIHVVAVDDRRIVRDDGSEIPQTVLVPPPGLYATYELLSRRIDDIKCRGLISALSPIYVSDWLESLAMERLHVKAQRILDLFAHTFGDWAQSMFIILCRSLGFGYNALPFELLAKSLPLKYIGRHADNLLQIEALLLGQAGFLRAAPDAYDDYYRLLADEYNFLSRKYSLTPIREGLWKTSRPANSPIRRIAVLAGALYRGLSLTDKLLEARGDIDQLRQIFSWKAGKYWGEYISFAHPGRMPVNLSPGSVDTLLINVVAPFYMAYGAQTGEPQWGERAVSLLMDLPAETNSRVRCWHTCGIKAKDALQSQALIQLRTEYCDSQHCLDCRFAYYMLKSNISSPT
ncbi:MAG: DUF2851 family protein [Clostridium sp.]|nr:DUF2851 family protein [Prevotella sp.]MCM1428874.1 DUF2851 family protein [Clostridium sp.]MCM1475253.1 DUF2851 family protein [Muribaculaceae bacterium]